MTTIQETYACPMCSHDCDGREEFRFHLLTRHAKSDIVEKLLDDDADAAVVEAV